MSTTTSPPGEFSQSAREIAAESVIIPVRAAGLLLRHLPQLITCVCLGLTGRQAVIWLAVWISNFSKVGASLVMPLAPLSVMVALIYALWYLRPSLPFLSRAIPGREETSSRTRLFSAGGMLISFLTVYATHGMLKEDLATFRRAATNDEFMNQGFAADFSRVFVDGTASLLALIAVTIVLRKIIGYFALAERGLGLTYLAAYLDVLWMSTVSIFVTNKLADVQDWALSRRGIAPAYDRYVDLRDGIAEHTGILASAWDWLTEALPVINQLVTIPVAWLALGAVVFGTSLVASREKEAAPDAEAADSSQCFKRRARHVVEKEAKYVANQAMQPIAGPLKTTWSGLRTLAKAGIVPMVMFCIVFMLAAGVELGVVEVGRAIVGPQDALVSEVIAAYILIVARAAYLLLVVCLIASGLDFFLRRSYSPAADPDASLALDSGSST